MATWQPDLLATPTITFHRSLKHILNLLPFWIEGTARSIRDHWVNIPSTYSENPEYRHQLPNASGAVKAESRVGLGCVRTHCAGRFRYHCSFCEMALGTTTGFSISMFMATLLASKEISTKPQYQESKIK